MFLNNRYHDPTLGVFISVDPLVTSTGEAYIYAGGNPTTLSDPSGLEPCPLDGCKWEDSGGRLPIARQAIPDHPSRGDWSACGSAGSTASYCDTSSAAYWQQVEELKRQQRGQHPWREPPPMPPVKDAPLLWADILRSIGSLDDPDGLGSAIGACGEVGGSAGATGSATSCLMVDTDGISIVSTLGAGASLGAPSMSGSVGTILSNADAKDHAAWGMCGNVAGGAGFGGTGALCGGITYAGGEWSANGVWVLYVGGSVTTPSVEVSYTYTYTWVDRKVSWPWPS